MPQRCAVCSAEVVRLNTWRRLKDARIAAQDAQVYALQREDGRPAWRTQSQRQPVRLALGVYESERSAPACKFICRETAIGGRSK
jgi:hypothetical protein